MVGNLSDVALGLLSPQGKQYKHPQNTTSELLEADTSNANLNLNEDKSINNEVDLDVKYIPEVRK